VLCFGLHICWAGLGWAGLGWAGLGWAGLGWAGLGWAVRPRTGPPAADEPRTSAQCAKRRGKSTVCTASTDFIAQCMSKPIDSSKMHIFDAIWKRTAHRIASQH
jgi:hypothetical protein